MIDVPERQTILRLLGKPPPRGAQGLTTVGVAAALGRATRSRRLTATSMRTQLFQLEQEGLGECRIGQGGVATWELAADGGASHRHPRRPPERKL